MLVLGIESSCDETAASVLVLEGTKAKPKAKILSNLIASQHEIHAPYGGIFPELASRRHIEVIRPLVQEALKQAGIFQNQLQGIAVTHAPGLVGALLVGLSFAKAYAYGLGIPFVGVNHLEGHLNAPLLEHAISYPQIGLIVSGGHTALYLIKKFGCYEFLGGTRDDAAGEAFDKVAKILGLGYPGGPIVDTKSKDADPKAVRFPKAKVKDFDFSFSGLKTAVRQLTEGKIPVHFKPKSEKLSVQDICASFQEAVVDTLVEKTIEAARKKRCKNILVTGGVACNSRLRVKMKDAAEAVNIKTFFASPVLCTDNAAMIAYVGGRKLLSGDSSPLNLNALANVSLNSIEAPSKEQVRN